jgi:hypothetical protein
MTTYSGYILPQIPLGQLCYDFIPIRGALLGIGLPFDFIIPFLSGRDGQYVQHLGNDSPQQASSAITPHSNFIQALAAWNPN